MKIIFVSIHTGALPQAMPLAALNLQAALSDLDCEVEQYNCAPTDSPQQIVTELQRSRAQLISFSLYLWNRSSILEIARHLRQQPDCPFLLAGGPEASAAADSLLRSNLFDALIRGEGEESLHQLVRQLQREQEPEQIAGFCRPGEPLKKPAICDPQNLPSPWLQGLAQPLAGGALWEVARGCPFQCDFCYDARGTVGVRPLPFERLRAELGEMKKLGIEQIWVLDSSFNVPTQRGKKLLQLLLQEAPDFHYHFEAKAEFLDQETIDLLEQLSCSVQLGLQSSDTDVLEGLNRRIPQQRFWQGVECIARSRVTFGFDLIYGLPGDSPARFRASLERALGYQPNQIEAFPLALLPGTRLAQRQQELQLQASSKPPYLLQSSPDFRADEMRACAELAQGLDLFYNRGRSVAMLAPLCQLLQQSCVDFLYQFEQWRQQQGENESELLTAEDILAQQQAFLRQRLLSNNQLDYLDLVEDLLNYHYQYAETLLGQETLPQSSPLPSNQLVQRSPGVRLLQLHYDLLGALESEAIDLTRWQRILPREVTPIVLLRRGSEVLSENLTAEFNLLLQTAKQPLHLKVLQKKCRTQGDLIRFALQEGLLQMM